MRESFVRARNFATQTVPLPADADPAVLAKQQHNPQDVIDPFLGFDDRSADPNLGLELAVAAHAGDKRPYTVLMLGGSVSAILTTISAQVFVQAVKQDPRFEGVRMRLSNHARGGYKQPQQVNELVFLLATGYRPDAVINIDGFNDVALGNDNIEEGIHPLYPSHSHWLHVTGLVTADREATLQLDAMRAARQRVVCLADFGLKCGLWRSSVLGTILHRGMRRGLSNAGAAQAAYEKRLLAATADRGLTGPPFERDENALAISVEGWAQSSLCIQAICNARGIPYLHVLQPTLHDEGAKPATAEEKKLGEGKASWVEGVRIGYPLLRARGEKLRQEGVNFVDASRLFADVHETFYYDVCHFGKVGNDMLAQFVARAFLESLVAEDAGNASAQLLLDSGTR
jgi:hypothetical protein